MITLASLSLGERVRVHDRIGALSKQSKFRVALDFQWGQGPRSQLGVLVSMAYIEKRDDVYTVSGSRVSLDSIVYAFLSGESAESIAQGPVIASLVSGGGGNALFGVR